MVIMGFAEKMAKTKWCPMVMMCFKLPNGKPILAGNRPIHKGEGCCIASDCMMWVWAEPLRTERPIQNEQPGGAGWINTGEYAELHKASPKPTDEAIQRVKIWERSFPEERRGYCGLINQGGIENE